MHTAGTFLQFCLFKTFFFVKSHSLNLFGVAGSIISQQSFISEISVFSDLVVLLLWFAIWDSQAQQWRRRERDWSRKNGTPWFQPSSNSLLLISPPNSSLASLLRLIRWFSPFYSCSFLYTFHFTLPYTSFISMLLDFCNQKLDP